MVLCNISNSLLYYSSVIVALLLVVLGVMLLFCGPLKYYVTQWGGGMRGMSNFPKKPYKSVRFNFVGIINVTRV